MPTNLLCGSLFHWSELVGRCLSMAKSRTQRLSLEPYLRFTSHRLPMEQLRMLDRSSSPCTWVQFFEPDPVEMLLVTTIVFGNTAIAVWPVFFLITPRSICLFWTLSAPSFGLYRARVPRFCARSPYTAGQDAILGSLIFIVITLWLWVLRPLSVSLLCH